MLQIAWANWQGLGIPQNTSSALEWYRQAQISGGKDVQQSGRLGEAQVLQIEHPAQAFEAFRELAEQGSPYLYAMPYLAEAYWRGRGIGPDKAAAVYWYQRAQRSDNPDIQRRARLEDRSEVSMRQFYHWLGGHDIWLVYHQCPKPRILMGARFPKCLILWWAIVGSNH